MRLLPHIEIEDIDPEEAEILRARRSERIHRLKHSNDINERGLTPPRDLSHLSSFHPLQRIELAAPAAKEVHYPSQTQYGLTDVTFLNSMRLMEL